MLSPEEAYKYDATFRRMVDIMRQELTLYSITPSELRQAAILAAAMHESQRVKPLFTRSYFPAKPWGGMEVFIDEAKDIPPAMFGGTTAEKRTCICGYTGTMAELHSSACKHYNWEIDHPTCKEHCHIFHTSGYGFDVCADCGMSEIYYNWAYNKKS